MKTQDREEDNKIQALFTITITLFKFLHIIFWDKRNIFKENSYYVSKDGKKKQNQRTNNGKLNMK